MAPNEEKQLFDALLAVIDNLHKLEMHAWGEPTGGLDLEVIAEVLPELEQNVRNLRGELTLLTTTSPVYVGRLEWSEAIAAQQAKLLEPRDPYSEGWERVFGKRGGETK